MIVRYWDALVSRLEGAGNWLPNLFLRLILAWEFWESGMEKYNGSNWFGHVMSDFPFPFNYAPADLSWFMATWAELIGAFALLLGIKTRFTAFALMILTVVATVAVHWPAQWSTLGQLWEGYRITAMGDSGNFKLPLLFFIMLLPLLFRGAGKLSIDHLIHRLHRDQPRQPVEDVFTIGWGALVLGIPLLFALPWFAGLLILIGVGALLLGYRQQRVAPTAASASS